MATTPDNSLGNGVFYAIEESASFSRRLSAIVIDLAVVMLASFALWYLLFAIFWYGFSRDPSTISTYAQITLTWFYLTWLKTSSFRTVGYRIAGLKIVNLKGTRPSLFRMTFRLLLWIIGPGNLLVDLFWIAADSDNQTLRDCFASTYVIRHDAEPIGDGPIHLAYYNALGIMLMYPRVVRPSTR